MDGLIGPRATLVAAWGSGLLGLNGLVDVVRVMLAAWGVPEDETRISIAYALVYPSVRLLVSLGGCFFVALHRAKQGQIGLRLLRRAAAAVLILILLPLAVVWGGTSFTSVFFDAFGIASTALSGLLIMGWSALVYMIGFRWKRDYLSGLAITMVVITACVSLGTVNQVLNALVSIFNGSLAQNIARFGGPAQQLWREVVTPAVNFCYAASLLIFLVALRHDWRSLVPAEGPVSVEDLRPDPHQKP